MKTLIDYALESLKTIKPHTKNLIEKECQIIYYEIIENEIDSMSKHREEI